MKASAKRSTIYLDEDLHKALRLKAAATSRTISDLVNETVRHALAEDETDLSAYHERVNEPSISYEEFIRDLKQNGRI